MRFSYRVAGFAVAVIMLTTTGASAQLCGISLDCDWDVPNVAHYAFDDGGGSIAVDSVNGNNGVWDGGVGDNVWVGGLIGGASQTNDENGGNGQEHYSIPSLPQLDGSAQMSISLWFNTNVADNNNSTYNGLFMSRNVTDSSGGGGNYGLALENNNSPRHIDWRQDGVPGTEDDLIIGNVQDQWFHVVMTWDGSDLGAGMGERALFLDGVELQREDTAIETIISTGAWDIGNDTCCSAREFTGTLDDAAVWNTVLDATDVNQIYLAGLEGVSAIKVEPPRRGDVDLDDDVDLIDFGVIQTNFFTEEAERANGDLTSDGSVEWADFREWKDNFPFPSTSNSTSVPEPTSLFAAAAAVGISLLRRRS